MQRLRILKEGFASHMSNEVKFGKECVQLSQRKEYLEVASGFAKEMASRVDYVGDIKKILVQEGPPSHFTSDLSELLPLPRGSIVAGSLFSLALH